MHLSLPAIAPLLDDAEIFHVEGHFLTHGTGCPGTRQEGFGSQFQVSLPYITDYLTSNEDWTSVNGLPDPNYLPAVAKALVQPPGSETTRNRVESCTPSSYYAKLTSHENGLQYQRVHNSRISERGVLVPFQESLAYVRDRR